jgi:hexosaminidase
MIMQLKIVTNTFLYIAVFLAFASLNFTARALELIPKPLYVKENGGSFTLSSKTQIVADKELLSETKLLRAYIKSSFALNLKEGSGQVSHITLVINKNIKGINTERYRLEVTSQKVSIIAAESKGILHGIQTLRQLTKQNEKKIITIPCVQIEDEPRFAWREFMLDEARFFRGKDAVKQILDQMSLLKMNVFHWHLTDNTGWRIHINKYPLLTKIGSKRDSSEIKINGKRGGFYDGKHHEGFYTQKDIKEIVAYAAARHITVVPEIDMPGHTSAAIAAYPWLGSNDKVIKVPHSFANQKDVLKVSDPKVWQFVTDVLDEVMYLFPSKVIHIGGDEVNYEHWKNSAEINAFIKKNELSSAADLQIWFTNRVSHYLESKGRRMMGWNEILGTKIHDEDIASDFSVKSKLASNTIVDFWKGDLQLMREALGKGYHVVNSLHTGTYMNYTGLSLKAAYSFDPVPEGLDFAAESKILGSSSHLWSEWIPTVKSMQELIYPRLAAYAETGWTAKANKSYSDFLSRLPLLYLHWDKAGITYKIDPKAK